MDDTVYKVAMGGLLHDIGKVVQRSEKKPFDKKHGQWGFDWLKDLNIFNEGIINATITHHKYDTGVFESNIGLIWYEADNLASSERKSKNEQEKEKWDIYTPLVSPFFKVRNPNNIEEHLKKIPYIDIKTEFIPFTTFEKPIITQDEYDTLLKHFKSDLIQLNKTGITINNLLMLIEKHFSKIPSITAEMYEGGEENIYKHPDISLFDHLKLTSAIASSMYYYYSDKYANNWNKDVLKEEILKGTDDAYLLIGGDISGVQKFIYTITSKGALKSLKGRSFFLELLTEHIVSELLDKLKLSRCNLIFSGGGHFYILAYNTDKAKEAINDVKNKIDDYLFSEFKGSLQVHISYVAFNKEGFANAVAVWQSLSSKLEEAKKKKWKNKISDLLKIEGQHKDCLTDYCKVCFREDKPLEKIQRIDEEVLVCPSCKYQYELGNELSKISSESTCYIAKFTNDDNKVGIKIGDYIYQIIFGNIDLKGDYKAVYVINNFNVNNYAHPNSIYLPLGVYQHRKIDEISDAVDKFGIERIAVLRMDVDNLGKIFSIAIPEEDRTFSRMASISRNLNYFFKSSLNLIASGRNVETLDIVDRDIKNKGRYLSIVYSGGDDLFIIGHWLDVLECAYDIRKTFEKFTGNNFITISGGLTINHEKYPVYQYARDAEDLEKSAKNSGKNALSIFNEKRVIKWSNFEKIIDRINLFREYLITNEKSLVSKEKGLPKTFFYRLLSLARRFNEEGILILPKCAYLISRIKSGNEKTNLKIKEVIMNVNKEDWEITEIATLLILMMMRKGGN